MADNDQGPWRPGDIVRAIGDDGHDIGVWKIDKRSASGVHWHIRPVSQAAISYMRLISFGSDIGGDYAYLVRDSRTLLAAGAWRLRHRTRRSK